MSNHPSVLELLPALHQAAKRILPERYHGRIRPSDLAQTTAQILLRSNITRISCVVSWSRGIIRKLIAREFSKPIIVPVPSEPRNIIFAPAIQGASDTATGRESFADMLRAAKLDPASRLILHEYFVEGQSMRAIADRLGMPLSTLHGRFHEALDAVRESRGDESRPD